MNVPNPQGKLYFIKDILADTLQNKKIDIRSRSMNSMTIEHIIDF